MKTRVTLASILLLCLLCIPQNVFAITLQGNSSYNFEGSYNVIDANGTVGKLSDFDTTGRNRNLSLVGTVTTGNIQNGVLSNLMINLDQRFRDNVFFAHDLQGNFLGAPVVEGLQQVKFNAFTVENRTIQHGNRQLDIIAWTTDVWNIYGDQALFGIVNGGGAFRPTLHSERYALFAAGNPFTAFITSDGWLHAWARGRVDGGFAQVDFSVRLSDLGGPGGPGAPVPEPASLALLSAGMLGAGIRRRRKKLC